MARELTLSEGALFISIRATSLEEAQDALARLWPDLTTKVRKAEGRAKLLRFEGLTEGRRS